MFCLHSLLGVLWCLILRSLSHFEFIFVYGVRECSNFIDLHVTRTFPTPLAEETVFSSLYILASFLMVTLTEGSGQGIEPAQVAGT